MTNKIRTGLLKLFNTLAAEWLDIELVRLGKDSSQVVETGTPGLLWARLDNGKPIKVRVGIANCPSRFDLHVLVGRKRRQPKVWQVIDVQEDYDNPAGGGELTYHHHQHEFPSADTVWVYRDQFMPFLVLPNGGMTVKLFGDIL